MFSIDDPRSKHVDEIVSAVQQALPSTDSLDGLPQAAADLLAVVTAQGIIGNGGHRYWYEGMGAAQTRRAAEAWDRIGAPDAAAAMRRSLELLGPVPEDKRMLCDELDARWDDELEQAFEALDDTVCNTDCAARSAEYILDNEAELASAFPAIRGAIAALRRHANAD